MNTAPRSRRLRATLAMAVVIALVGVFVVRLADIQLVQAAELNSQSQNKREIVQTTYGDRGDITDVDGTVLAGSVTRYNITAAPAFATTAKVKDDDGTTVEMTVDQVVDRMSTKYPLMARSHIQGMVSQVHAGFLGNPVRSYVPVLVERQVKARLAQEALALAAAG